ncbi:MAG: hypothetical protein M1828_002268 [Chrysothrix sp. TS-e1954]|nr:MAG: hypothetical protein M1828_002268 [Chrysothrix sp. TS-e1954]
MPDGEGGVCYREAEVVNENFQMCDITNRKIIDALDPRVPQATFSCNRERSECNFQFWIQELESFYCALESCSSRSELEPDRNTTKYSCDTIKCRCVPGRPLCGEEGTIDISDFLTEEIVGPASFTSTSTEGGSASDGSLFMEPHMDDLISSVFGDRSITLNCRAGECLYQTEVPGYEKPVKKINTPLIAGVIAGSALFVVLIILLVWFLSRRQASKHYGPITLGDDDDANAKLMADHKPAALHFQDISYDIGGKQIISGVQGAVRPGELLAIMGASGAGKTTLLDILARKNKRGIIHGSSYVNGEIVPDNEFRSVIGFVDQEDTLLPTLTVHETILDSAMLRLPKDMSLGAKEQKVEDVERQLGIHHIRDQFIGSEEGSGRGISGGEKRRVGIACELVTSPSILFLDEPTSGLDAYNAYNVVECLVNLVKTYNRTVIFTIHQPRSNIVALFDQLLLLAQGHVVYSGPFSSCQNYFDSIGYSCPPGFNIADYLVDLTMHVGMARSPMDDIIEASEPTSETRSSSLLGVKSVASKSNLSTSENEYVRRVRDKNRASTVKQQEHQLFGRRAKGGNAGAETPTSQNGEDEALLGDENSKDSQQAWLRLSRQSGQVPPQILEDPHQLPPEVSATGTDLDNIIFSYTSSDVAASLLEDIKSTVDSANSANGNGTPRVGQHINGTADGTRVKLGYRKVGLLGQFRILSLRTWRNLYRNPFLMLTHYAIAILVAVLVGFLFYGLTDDIAGFQNRLGLFFFILALFGFSTLTTLTVFATERLLFMRERAKGYYAPLSYFVAKVLFDIVPLRLIPPMILGIIVYPMTGLTPAWPEFLRFIAFLILFNLAAAAICLFVGIVFKNGGMANLIGSLVMLFSLLFAGFLLNHETIPKSALWLQVLSIFHYGFEGLLINDVKYLSLTDHKYGLDIGVPGSAILSSFGFDVQAINKNFLGLGVYAAVFLVLGYAALHLLLVERR